MALGTEEAAHNTAIDAAIVTWGAAVAAAAENETLMICGTDVQRGVTAAGPPAFVPGDRTYIIKCEAGTEAADNIWAIGGWHVARAMGCSPFFWKFTNQAGDT